MQVLNVKMGEMEQTIDVIWRTIQCDVAHLEMKDYYSPLEQFHDKRIRCLIINHCFRLTINAPVNPMQ